MKFEEKTALTCASCEADSVEPPSVNLELIPEEISCSALSSKGMITVNGRTERFIPKCFSSVDLDQWNHWQIRNCLVSIQKLYRVLQLSPCEVAVWNEATTNSSGRNPSCESLMKSVDRRTSMVPVILKSIKPPNRSAKSLRCVIDTPDGVHNTPPLSQYFEGSRDGTVLLSNLVNRCYTYSDRM